MEGKRPLCVCNRGVAVERLGPVAGLIEYSLKKGEFGAGEGIRTLDPNLGKVVLYH